LASVKFAAVGTPDRRLVVLMPETIAPTSSVDHLLLQACPTIKAQWSCCSV